MMQEITTKGGLYTPDQILNPSFLGSTDTDAVPLCIAIQLLKQAVSNLIQQANQVGKERVRTKGRVSLRIEQQVSQSVDPSCLAKILFLLFIFRMAKILMKYQE